MSQELPKNVLSEVLETNRELDKTSRGPGPKHILKPPSGMTPGPVPRMS
jgi:hypothetical protein